MPEIGNVIGSEIDTNRDGDREVRILKVEITDPEDNQSIEFMQDAGSDSLPPLDSQVLILSLGEAWRLAVAVNDGIAPDDTIEPGEKRFYSSDSGTLKALIKLFKDGKVKINGGGRNVARKDDATIINATTDTAFIAWVANVSAVLNTLVPGSVPSIPTTATGKVNDGSADVEVS